MIAKETKLLAFLAQLGVPHKMYRHPPVMTVAEAQKNDSHMPPGVHVKNLFLTDKKKVCVNVDRLPRVLCSGGGDAALTGTPFCMQVNRWVVTVPEDAAVDMKLLGALVGAKVRQEPAIDTPIPTLLQPASQPASKPASHLPTHPPTHQPPTPITQCAAATLPTASPAPSTASRRPLSASPTTFSRCWTSSPAP